MTPLNILHVFRAPVGDLYRHVLDLAREQIARGHRVGLIADSKMGGRRAQETLKELAPSLALGLTRVPIRRHIGPNDATILGHVMGRIAGTRADVVHGHGAKGGAYARLAFNASRAVRAYTPHGGSLLFGPDTTAGKFYLATEKLLMPRGDLFLFESAYSAEIFRRKIGTPHGLVRIVHNGVSEKKFAPVKARADATDLVFVGEFQPVKGIDVLIDAIAKLNRNGRHVTTTLVGAAERESAWRAGRASGSDKYRQVPARHACTRGTVAWSHFGDPLTRGILSLTSCSRLPPPVCPQSRRKSVEFLKFTVLLRTAWSRRRTSAPWPTPSHETSTNLKKPWRRHDCCASVCHSCFRSKTWSTECYRPTNRASTACSKVLAVRTVTRGV